MVITQISLAFILKSNFYLFVICSSFLYTWIDKVEFSLLHLLAVALKPFFTVFFVCKTAGIILSFWSWVKYKINIIYLFRCFLLKNCSCDSFVQSILMVFRLKVSRLCSQQNKMKKLANNYQLKFIRDSF